MTNKTLESQILKAWNCVRGLPEYKNDYESQVQAIRERRLEHYEVTPGLLENLNQQLASALPAHLKEQALKQCSMEQYDIKLQQQLKETWGFYPLADPKRRQPPHLFADYIENFTVKSYSPAAKIKDFDFDLQLSIAYPRKQKRHPFFRNIDRSLPALPLTVEMLIDVKHPESDIIRDLMVQVKRIQKAYNIKPKRGRISDLFETYTSDVLRKLGYKGRKVREAIYPAISKPGDDPSPAKKRLQRRRRRIKKEAKIGTG